MRDKTLEDLIKMLEVLNVKDFKVVGKKVIIKNLVIYTKPKSLFENIKYDLYVSNLTADNIPFCIKSCDELSIDPSEKFTGYLPKVRDRLMFYRGKKQYTGVDVEILGCRKVLLNQYRFSGKVVANDLRLNCDVDNLKVYGFGANSFLNIESLYVRDTIKISDFELVRFKSLSFYESSHTMEISNAKVLDISKIGMLYTNYLKEQMFKLNNVDTLVVSTGIGQDYELECNYLKFQNSNVKGATESVGTYLCKELEFDNMNYNKSNKDSCPLPFVKFK